MQPFGLSLRIPVTRNSIVTKYYRDGTKKYSTGYEGNKSDRRMSFAAISSEHWRIHTFVHYPSGLHEKCLMKSPETQDSWGLISNVQRDQFWKRESGRHGNLHPEEGRCPSLSRSRHLTASNRNYVDILAWRGMFTKQRQIGIEQAALTRGFDLFSKRSKERTTGQ
jgi:hypothetical protein